MASHHPCFGKPTFAITVVTPEEDFLRIPDHFVAKYLSSPPSRLKLYAEDGLMWDVVMKERKGSLYITTGWADFKTCYAVTHSDKFMFIYDSPDTMYVCHHRPNGEAVKKTIAELITGTDQVEMERYRINIRVIDGHVEALSTEGRISDAAGGLLAMNNSLPGDSPVIRSVNSKPAGGRITLSGFPVRELAFAPRSTPTSPVPPPTDNMDLDNVVVGSSSKRLREEHASIDDAVVPTFSDDIRAAIRASKRQFKDYERQQGTGRLKRKHVGGGSSSGQRLTDGANEVTELINIEDDERIMHCKLILTTHDVLENASPFIPFPFGHSNLMYGLNPMVLRVSAGREWPVVCVLDDESATVEVGWYKFVVDNTLMPGDTLVIVQNMIQKNVWEIVITEGLGA